jgi:hypothetical protein
VQTDWRPYWGRGYKFLPQLGFIYFPVDLIHLQVQKPASADLHNSKFIKDWGEINPEFFPELFDAGARVRYPTGAHKCASVHTVTRAFDLKLAL